MLSLGWSYDSSSCIMCTCRFQTDSSVSFFYAGSVFATEEAVNTRVHVDFFLRRVCYVSKGPLHLMYNKLY